jgi:maleate cis-trans isomerase
MLASVTGPKRVGFLYPDHAAEDDLPWLVQALFPDRSVVADVVHTSIGEDAHTVEALRETGRRWRLREGARLLRTHRATVAIWACTSGSFVFGLGGARRQADELAVDFGGPASSTSLAFVSALAALGLQKVAVAGSYPEPLARHFLALLTDAGSTIVNAATRGIFTAAQVGRLVTDDVLDLVCDADHPDAQAILVPDTALHTVRSVDRLEAAVGKPVLTANQVSVWEALRLIDARPRHPGLGALFARPPMPSAD